MKAYVFTNEKGEITGTFRPNPSPDPGAPSFMPRPCAGVTIHELDLPQHLHEMTSPDEFHKEVAKLIDTNELQQHKS